MMTNTKRALVTSGNCGIGLAIAQGLLAQGYEVIITARSIDSANKAAERLGGKAIPLELDVSDDRSIDINAMCPSWVRTDMGGASADRSPEQGADTAIWLATAASRNETGKFWRDRTVVTF